MDTARLPLESVVYEVQLPISYKDCEAVKPVSLDGKVRV